MATSDILRRYLHEFGVWEPDLTAWVRRAPRPGDTFIDVGANIGYYTLLAAHLVGHVVAAEPSPRSHEIMTAAVAASALGPFQRRRSLTASCA